MFKTQLAKKEKGLSLPLCSLLPVRVRDRFIHLLELHK